MDFLLILMVGLALGYYTVCRVPSVFHAPLMSLTNGVSSICVVVLLDQGIKVIPQNTDRFWILICITVIMLFLNISGGFYITQRMINFFYPSESSNKHVLSLKKVGIFYVSFMISCGVVYLASVAITKLPSYMFH